MYLTNKKCGNCILYVQSQNICQLTNQSIDKEKDYCSKHLTQDDVFTCDICSKLCVPFDDVIVNIDGNNFKHLCSNCSATIKTCRVCENMPKCPFETDPNPIPKVIIQEQQFGNGKVQTQIKNPEREKLFCHDCCCWNTDENVCMKDTGFECKNKKINYLA